MGIATDYTMSVILKAKAEGLTAFAEMAAAVEVMKGALESVRNVELRSSDSHSTLEKAINGVGNEAYRAGARMREFGLDMRRSEQDANLAERGIRRLGGDALRLLGNGFLEAGLVLGSASGFFNRTTQELGQMSFAFMDVEKAATKATGSSGSGGGGGGMMAFINAIIPGGQTAAGMTIAISALALVFAPLTVELAASLVLLGAWVVGATAFAAVVGIAAGGLALLAGGVIALGIAQQGGLDPAQALEKATGKLTTATEQLEGAQEAVRLAQLRYDARPTAVNLQVLRDAQEQLTENQKKAVDAQNAVNTATANANGPMGQLRQSVEDMAAALGQAAIPMTNQMLSSLLPLVPRVQAAGQSLIDWFGPRLPAVLKIAADATDNLFKGLDRLAVGWGKVVDYALARSPEFGSILNGAFNRVIDGALGLLENLVRVSDWFVVRLPVLGKNANDTLGNLGLVIQAVGQGLGIFVDWVIAHWPAINAAFNATWLAIQQGWGAVAPALKSLQKTLDDLRPTLQYIQANAKELLPIFTALGFVLGLAVAALASLGVSLIYISALLVWLAQKTHEAVDEWIKAGRDIGTVMSYLGTQTREYEKQLGISFSMVGSFLHQSALAFEAWARQGGEQFSALGRAAHQMQSDIGGVFSAIGSAAQTLVHGIGVAFDGIGSAIHGGLVSGARAYNNFAGAVNGVLGAFKVHIDPIPGFAKGGTVPGYSPGEDSVLARLSPGEGVLTPQTVRGLGGSGAVEALNNMGEGLGGLANIGSWGGQCVAFVQQMLGLSFRGNANEWVNAPYAHTQTARPGEVAVFTGGDFGHVAIVTSPGDGYSFPVIDSNWVAPETIGTHVMNKGMYGFSTFLDTGASGPVLNGIPGITIPIDLLNGLVDKSLGGLGGWPGALARGLMEKTIGGIKHNLGLGGITSGSSSMSLPSSGGASYAPSAPAQGRSGGTYHITFNIQGQDAEQIARAVDRRLSQALTST